MSIANPSKIPPRAGHGALVNVVIDTPGGSRNNYRFDEEPGVFRISRILLIGILPPSTVRCVLSKRNTRGEPWPRN
jgi:inorganic pyrophosphatase